MQTIRSSIILKNASFPPKTRSSSLSLPLNNNRLAVGTVAPLLLAETNEAGIAVRA